MVMAEVEVVAAATLRKWTGRYVKGFLTGQNQTFLSLFLFRQ
jgi:hypothetical protein